MLCSVTISSYHDAQIVPDLANGSSFKLAPVSFAHSHSLNISMLCSIRNVPSSHCTFPAPNLESDTSSTLGSFSGEWYFEAKILSYVFSLLLKCSLKPFQAFLTTAISADRCLWRVYMVITQQPHNYRLYSQGNSWVSFTRTYPFGILQDCSQSLGFLRNIPFWIVSFISTPRARYTGEESYLHHPSPQSGI